MQIGQNTTFTQIQNKFGTDRTMLPGAGNKHLRFDGGTKLYTHSSSPFITSRKGPAAAQERAQKQADGAGKVKQAIDHQYGAGTADRVFANIRGSRGIDLNAGVRRSDLGTIAQAIQLDRAGVPANDPLLLHLGTATYLQRFDAVTTTIQKAGGDDHGLTPSEQVALYGYTSTDDCYALNRQLRVGGPPEGSTGEMYLDLIKSGMAKLPSAPGTSYRGVGAMPVNVVNAYQDAARAKGNAKIITELAFTSTSTSNDKSFAGGYQYTIDGQNGKDVSAFSKHDEQEVLYPPGTQFSVVKVDGEADYSGGLLGGEMHIMMREV